MKEKTDLINADELPKDVAGGEALLDRHRQHKVGKRPYFHRPPPRGRKRGGPRVPESFLLHFKTFLPCGHSTRLTLTMTDFNMLMRLVRNCWTPVMMLLMKFRKR